MALSLRANKNIIHVVLSADFTETLKWKHKAAVKSSGYGQVYTPPKPPRDASRDKDILGYSRSQTTKEGKCVFNISEITFLIILLNF